MSEPRVKLLLQQCTSAELRLPEPRPESGSNVPAVRESGAPDPDGVVRIGRGLVVFVCFLAGCEAANVIRAANTALNLRLSEPPPAGDGGAARRTSVTLAAGDVLVVPQATLGGRVKGRQFQYHGNVDKAAGAGLYAEFVSALAEGACAVEGWREAGCRVRCGVFGARQVLSMTTNGPFTHAVEL